MFDYPHEFQNPPASQTQTKTPKIHHNFKGNIMSSKVGSQVQLFAQASNKVHLVHTYQAGPRDSSLKILCTK